MKIDVRDEIIDYIKQVYRDNGLYVPKKKSQWRQLIEILILEGLSKTFNLSSEKESKMEEFRRIIIRCVMLLMFIPFVFAGHYVNLNTATEQELISTPGITPQVANAILVYRQKYGEFKTVSEIYNACWEMSLPVSEEYVKFLISQANLYAVSVDNWRKGLADTPLDLINPTVVFHRKTNDGVNYLFKLFDGGNFVVLTRDVELADIAEVKKRVKGSIFLKPIIDWLVVTKPDINFMWILKNFRVKNIYLPLKYLNPVDKSLPVNYVDTKIEIDCYQSYPFYVVVEPIERSRLAVTFCYDDPRIVISPHPLKTELRCNPFNPDDDIFLFDGALMYFPEKGRKAVVKKPRRSVIAEEERERLYEEFKERAIYDYLDEIEAAWEE